MAKITPKQKKFIELFSTDGNRVKAYKIAYQREDLSNEEASKRASALLKKEHVKSALYNTKCLKSEGLISKGEVIGWAIDLGRIAHTNLIKDKFATKNTIDGIVKSVETLSRLLGFNALEEHQMKIDIEEIKLKRERLEFDKSKIKKDNEDLQKENASLLRQLISKEEVKQHEVK